MGWPLAIAAALASYAGARISSEAQKKAIREKQRQIEEGIRQRTKKANERLTPIFKQASEDLGTDKEKKLFTVEDAKNLATINKTKSMVDNRLTGGLETGGKKSAQFQNLQSDRFTKAKAGQNKRDLALSRFLSPSRVGQIRGQAPINAAFGRVGVADELVADRNINDMRVSAIRPDSGMMAFGDALRIAGMMAGMYNMGAGMGAETAGGLNAGDFANLGDVAATPANFSNISTGAGQIGGTTAGNFAAQTGSFGSAVPWYQSAWNSVGDFFQPANSILPQQPSRLTTPSFGARSLFAPENAINMGVKSPYNDAWRYGNGNWWGGMG